MNAAKIAAMIGILLLAGCGRAVPVASPTPMQAAFHQPVTAEVADAGGESTPGYESKPGESDPDESAPGESRSGFESEPAVEEQPHAQPQSLPVLTPERHVGVPVLLYHHLVEVPGIENGAIIPLAEFAHQMDYLATRGYTTITTGQLARWLAGEESLPERSVLITFDDSYESTYSLAFPVLQRYGFKATIFVLGGSVGQTIGDYTYASWAQLQEMVDSHLIEIQSHTFDGHKMVEMVADLQRWTPEEIAADDARLKQALAEHGFERPFAIAYPFGSYSATAIDQLAARGYELGFTVTGGLVHRGDGPFTLKRRVIFPGLTLDRFSSYLD